MILFNGGEPPFFYAFFIIDYRGMSRKARKFFSSDYAFYKFNLIFVFFGA